MVSAKTSASTSGLRKDTLLSRRYIEGQIAEGKHILIYDDRVLKVDAWIPFHPGGDKSIKHMVGRDATDEINAYVPVIRRPLSSPPFIWVIERRLNLTAYASCAGYTPRKLVSACCRSKSVASRDHG